MTLKQGTILPTTGIGTGYLLLFIYGIIGWNIGFKDLLEIPAAYILLITPLIMQFSYKDFVVNENDDEHYYIRYRVLVLIPFRKRMNFRDFPYIVIRVMSKTYNVQQGVGPGVSIASGKHKEKYLALVGYANNGEKIEICKGKQNELDEIIKTYIQPLEIPVYLGAPKKGYEYFPK